MLFTPETPQAMRDLIAMTSPEYRAYMGDYDTYGQGGEHRFFGEGTQPSRGVGGGGALPYGKVLPPVGTTSVPVAETSGGSGGSGLGSIGGLSAGFTGAKIAKDLINGVPAADAFKNNVAFGLFKDSAPSAIEPTSLSSGIPNPFSGATDWLSGLFGGGSSGSAAAPAAVNALGEFGVSSAASAANAGFGSAAGGEFAAAAGMNPAMWTFGIPAAAAALYFATRPKPSVGPNAAFYSTPGGVKWEADNWGQVDDLEAIKGYLNELGVPEGHGLVYFPGNPNKPGGNDTGGWAPWSLQKDGQVLRSAATPEEALGMGTPGGFREAVMRAAQPYARDNRMYHEADISAGADIMAEFGRRWDIPELLPPGAHAQRVDALKNAIAVGQGSPEMAAQLARWTSPEYMQGVPSGLPNPFDYSSSAGP